jgi:hypothetical protein
MEPYQPHPNLSKEINDAIAESQLAGGVWLKKPASDQLKDEPVLPVGKTLHVQTQNTQYVIEKRGEDEFWISGNQRFCPEPIKCTIYGCNFGGSMIKVNFVGRGMYMEFSTTDHPSVIVTSEIKEIKEI